MDPADLTEWPALLWPDPDSGPWRVSFDWDRTAEGLIPCSMTVAHGGRSEPVTGALLRKLPVATLANEALLRYVSELHGAFEATLDLLKRGQRLQAQDPEAFAATVDAAGGLDAVTAEVRELKDAAAQAVEIAKAAEPQKRHGPGRPPDPNRGRDHFIEVAEVYKTAQLMRKRPTKAVAQRWQVADGTASRWVWRARNEFGLLPSTTKGRVRAGAPVGGED